MLKVREKQLLPLTGGGVRCAQPRAVSPNWVEFVFRKQSFRCNTCEDYARSDAHLKRVRALKVASGCVALILYFLAPSNDWFVHEYS